MTSLKTNTDTLKQKINRFRKQYRNEILVGFAVFIWLVLKDILPLF